MHWHWLRVLASSVLSLAIILMNPGFISASNGEHRQESRSWSGRHRLEFGMGYWNSGQRVEVSAAGSVHVETKVEDIVAALSYAYWVDDNLATQVSFRGLVAESFSIASDAGVTEETVVISSALLGIRYYPLQNSRLALHPFVSASVGPFIGVEDIKEIGHDQVSVNTRTLGSIGGRLGLGMDIKLGWRFMAGINIGYILMKDFAEPLAGGSNFDGPEFLAGFSILMG